MAFENTTYPTPNVTDISGMVEYANEVTQFHNFGAFGIAILMIIWIFSFRLSASVTDKAHLVAFFFTSFCSVLMWTIGFIEAGIMYTTIVLFIISFIVALVT